MSTICSAGHRRRVEEVNEAVLPPRVQPLPHTSLDVLFNIARKALWQVPWLWGRLPCCRGPYYIQRAACLQGCWRASEKDEFWGCLYSLMIKHTVCSFFFSLHSQHNASSFMCSVSNEVKYCKATSASPKAQSSQGVETAWSLSANIHIVSLYLQRRLQVHSR